MMAAKSVVGISWRRLEGDESDSDEGKRKPLQESNRNKQQTGGRKLTRSASFRRTLGNIKQKLKAGINKKKELLSGGADYTPLEFCSPVRRSPRLAKTSEDKMYSPFKVDTPSRTPRRMLHKPPKRCNMSSPRTFQRDLDTVNKAIESFHHMSNELDQVITMHNHGTPKMGVTRERRVPNMGAQTVKHRRRSQPAPVFV